MRPVKYMNMGLGYTEVVIVMMIIILPFLYETSRIFKYSFKFFTYYIMVSFNACILIPVFSFRPRNVMNLVLASHVCRFISPLLGIKYVLRGRENLEKERACIIVANHQSSLDVLGMFEIWPVMEKCTAIAKKELFYAWPFGLAAWLCGLIFIDRMNSNKAKGSMNEAGETIKKDKVKLWVFPEGTRKNTGEIHTFKKGAFHLAIASQLPILPVVYSQYYFLDEKRKLFENGKIIITTLEPISTEGLTTDDIEDLMSQVYKKMSETFQETSREARRVCN